MFYNWDVDRRLVLMIQLHQFAPTWGISASPFCLKLETYLRMAEIPYEVVIGDMGKAPKGKLPYIEDNGKTIADSNLIIEYLKTTYGDRVDRSLSKADKAISLAMCRLIDENLYWVIVYSRWIDPTNWQKTKADYFNFLPAPLRLFVPNLARKSVIDSLKGHGIGKHTPQEIYEIGCRDLAALSDFLGDKKFMMGDEPTSIDAVVYAVVTNIIWAPIPSPLQDFSRNLTNLVDYCDRMKAKYYPVVS
jgi:glutathione S-transferase